MKIDIRKIEKNELKKVFEIEKKEFEPMNYPLFVLKQYYDLFSDLFLVAVNENKDVLGYAIGGINNNNEGWLLTVATKQEYRGKGIGRNLCTSLIDLLNVSAVYLTTHPDNFGAIHLYKNLGFKVMSTQENYYGDNSPRHIMKLDSSSQK